MAAIKTVSPSCSFFLLLLLLPVLSIVIKRDSRLALTVFDPWTPFFFKKKKKMKFILWLYV